MPKPVRLTPPEDDQLSWIDIDLDKLDRNAAAIAKLVHEGATTNMVQQLVHQHHHVEAGKHASADAPQTGHKTSNHAVQDSGNGRSTKRTPTKICAVVKKHAYGLGATNIAHRLVNADCDMLAVYSPEEASELVAKAVTAPILMLMPISSLSRTDILYRHAVAQRLHLTIHAPSQVADVNRIGRTFGICMPVHLYIDTGMSRAGLNEKQFAAVVSKLGDYQHVQVKGVYSHLATADCDVDFAYEQAQRFTRLVDQHREALPTPFVMHLANTFGLLRDQSLHMDMVRPGLGLYGYGRAMLDGPILANAPALEPIVRWTSKIVHINHYARRSPVGYRSTHKLKRHSVLGIVPVGYGDGYPVALSNKATMRVHPRDPEKPIGNAKVLGRVNMDQVVIDLTDLIGDIDDSQQRQALMGSAVEVYSDDPNAENALPRLADKAKTNVYELLCNLHPSLPRRHHSEDAQQLPRRR